MNEMEEEIKRLNMKVERLEEILIDLSMEVGSIHNEDIKKILKKHKVIG